MFPLSFRHGSIAILLLNGTGMDWTREKRSQAFGVIYKETWEWSKGRPPFFFSGCQESLKNLELAGRLRLLRRPIDQVTLQRKPSRNQVSLLWLFFFFFVRSCIEPDVELCTTWSDRDAFTWMRRCFVIDPLGRPTSDLSWQRYLTSRVGHWSLRSCSRPLARSWWEIILLNSEWRGWDLITSSVRKSFPVSSLFSWC